jgi:hypothetical protein
MFQFINPSILFVLVAGLIPLIIHLLNRRKYKEVPFSTIHFLREMVHKEMSRLKIRQILLLIIRTLIIILLILAYSRPTLKSQMGLVSGKSATEVVVIADNSMSLNNLELTGNSLDKLRQWWFQLEELFDSNDRISVISGIEPPQIIANREPFSRELWNKIVNGIQPTVFRGNLNVSTIKALEVFRNSDLSNRELYIISDFQQTGINLPELPEIVSQLDENTRVFFLPVLHQNSDNVSIDSARVVNQLIEKNQAIQIGGALKNQNDKNYLNSMVSLVLEDERVGQENLNLPPAQLDMVRFDISLKKSGYISGYLENENDALLEDNRYYFNFYVPDHITILHIVPNISFESFLPTILKPVMDREVFKYEKMSLSDWSGVPLNSYQMIILEGLNQIPDGLITRLEQYHRLGKGLCVIPGSQIDIPNYNRLLGLLGIGKIVSLEGKPGTMNKYVSFGRVNWQHPIFEGLFTDRKDLNPINFFAYYKIKPSPRSESLIQFQNGSPFLMEISRNEGVSTIIAAPLQPDWTNILIRGFVVPLTYRIIYYSVTKSENSRRSITVGEYYQHSFGALSPPYQFQLIRPSGQEEKITPVFRGSDVIIKIEDNSEIGNYKILQGNKILMVYSVNHSPLESVSDYYYQEVLQDHYPNGTWIPDRGSLVKQIEKSRFGRELWPYLLGLVIILIFLEMALAYTGFSRPSSHQENQVAEYT